MSYHLVLRPKQVLEFTYGRRQATAHPCGEYRDLLFPPELPTKLGVCPLSYPLLVSILSCVSTIAAARLDLVRKLSVFRLTFILRSPDSSFDLIGMAAGGFPSLT